MALDISRSFPSRVQLHSNVSSHKHPLTTKHKGWKLTNGAMTPLTFPIVNCNPVAVVRFPYLGLLLGSHARGIPTAT